MRQQIIRTIKDIGLNIDEFKIGSGARDAISEIHYKPYQYNPYKPLREFYTVQYCGNIVAVWDIKKRVEMHASIDMNWNGTAWKDIHELRIREVRIQESDVKTNAAVMPIECFESYLRMAFDKDEKELFYTNSTEGDKVQIFTNRYERDPKLRQQAIDIHGTICQVCGFSFYEKYGEIGKDYIEVHHIKPISEGKRDVNPETDLVCICSNCHRMIHRRRDYVIAIDELKAMIES